MTYWWPVSPGNVPLLGVSMPARAKGVDRRQEENGILIILPWPRVKAQQGTYSATAIGQWLEGLRHTSIICGPIQRVKRGGGEVAAVVPELRCRQCSTRHWHSVCISKHLLVVSTVAQSDRW